MSRADCACCMPGHRVARRLSCLNEPPPTAFPLVEFRGCREGVRRRSVGPTPLPAPSAPTAVIAGSSSSVTCRNGGSARLRGELEAQGASVARAPVSDERRNVNAVAQVEARARRCSDRGADPALLPYCVDAHTLALRARTSHPMAACPAPSTDFRSGTAGCWSGRARAFRN